MRLALTLAAFLAIASIAAHTENARGSGIKSAQASSGSSCYANQSNELYKAFSPAEIATTPSPDWRLVHPGPCQCEGKTIAACMEPGDTEHD